jgi:hypothetical protein
MLMETMYAITALLFQAVLAVHFAVRKWRFDSAIRYGPVVYALSVPAAAVSLLLLLGGVTWSLWLGGFLFLVWATFGYTVEYIRGIEWRKSRRWPILGPYVLLYLATAMFYWWPLALVSRPLWYVGAALFLVGAVLNVTSHKRP